MSLVGKAFRCQDGVIRWVTHRSKRGMLHLRWLDEENDVWHISSKFAEDQFKLQIQQEVDAPQPGESFLLCGALGVITNERSRID